MSITITAGLFLILLFTVGCQSTHHLMDGGSMPSNPVMHFPEPIPTPTPHKGN